MWDRSPSSGNQADAAWRGMRADHFDVVGLQGTYRSNMCSKPPGVFITRNRAFGDSTVNVCGMPRGNETNPPGLLMIVFVTELRPRSEAANHDMGFPAPGTVANSARPLLAIWPVQLVRHTV